MKDVKSFGIRINTLEPEESKNFGRGPVQTLEAMIERDLGPLDILERYVLRLVVIFHCYPFNTLHIIVRNQLIGILIRILQRF